DDPRIEPRHPSPRAAMALGAQRRHQPAGAGTDHEHVGFDENSVKLRHRYHQGRGRFLTEGCTSTICSGQKISQLKQVMQCSRNLITGSSLVRVSPAISGATGAASM